eukprot:CFRG2019T1
MSATSSQAYRCTSPVASLRSSTRWLTTSEMDHDSKKNSRLADQYGAFSTPRTGKEADGDEITDDEKYMDEFDSDALNTTDSDGSTHDDDSDEYPPHSTQGHDDLDEEYRAGISGNEEEYIYDNNLETYLDVRTRRGPDFGAELPEPKPLLPEPTADVLFPVVCLQCGIEGDHWMHECNPLNGDQVSEYIENQRTANASIHQSTQVPKVTVNPVTENIDNHGNGMQECDDGSRYFMKDGNMYKIVDSDDSSSTEQFVSNDISEDSDDDMFHMSRTKDEDHSFQHGKYTDAEKNDSDDDHSPIDGEALANLSDSDTSSDSEVSDSDSEVSDSDSDSEVENPEDTLVIHHWESALVSSVANDWFSYLDNAEGRDPFHILNSMQKREIMQILRQGGCVPADKETVRAKSEERDRAMASSFKI